MWATYTFIKTPFYSRKSLNPLFNNEATSVPWNFCGVAMWQDPFVVRVLLFQYNTLSAKFLTLW